MKIIHELTLDVSRQGVQASVPITQHDTGIHVLLIHLRNGSKEIKLNSSLTATLYLSNDSYEIVTVYTENGAHPNTLECNVTPYMSSNVGELTAQLQIFEGAERVLSAPEFMLVIKEDRASGSNVLGSTPYAAVVAAQQAAQASASRAEEAQAGAEGFAQAAQTSAQNAASAAENALTVAAEKAAEVAERVAVEKASEAVENVVQEYVSSNASNALVGNVSGAIVSMDDVSPLEHKVAVKLSSKQLIPYPYADTTKTTNGITFTDNGDGTITVNGTANANTVYTLSWKNTLCNLKANTYYTLSGCPSGGSDDTYSIRYSADPSGAISDIGNGSSKKFDADIIHYQTVISIKSGTVCDNLIFKPQLEKGTEATPYTPYVPNNTQVTVKSFGENLISSVTERGNCTVSNGVVTQTRYDYRNFKCQYMNSNGITKTLFAGHNVNVGANSTVITITEYGITNLIFGVNGSSVDTLVNLVTLNPLPKGSYTLSWNVFSLDEGTLSWGDMQLEIDKGGLASPYKPYKEGETVTTTIAEGAELTSIAPNMTISTDKEGVVIDCTYNRDINIAFERLTQAIISAGGIV